MLTYLQKFNALAPDLREKVTNPKVMLAINYLEDKYRIDLATAIMRVMVKEIPVNDIDKYLTFEFNLSGDQASEVARELKERVFFDVGDYLELDKAKVANIETPAMAPAAPIVPEPSLIPSDKARAASFFFSPEDEEEIKALAKNLDTVMTSEQAGTDIEGKLNRILETLNISFSSQDMGERFKNIIGTYLRGIRKRIDTKMALMRPIDQGGLYFDEKFTDKILSIIDNADTPQPAVPAVGQDKPKFSVGGTKSASIVGQDVSPAPSVLDKVSQIGARDIAYDMKNLSEASRNKEIVLRAINEAVPAEPAAKQAAEIAIPVKKTEVQQAATPAGKIRMDDVKFTPKLVGPIDELAAMDTVSFRRLDESAGKAIQKIRDKIKYLEDEEYAKRLAGIRAWRSSPLNQLYLLLGKESIEQKKPVSAIIESRKTGQQDFLTAQEFEAIMELNRDLRF